MFCKECGKEIPTGKFCAYCGAETALPEDGAAQRPEPSVTVSQPAPKKSHGWVVGLCVGLVLILLVILAIPAVSFLTNSMNGLSSVFGSKNRETPSEPTAAEEGALPADHTYLSVWNGHYDYVLPDSDSAYMCFRDIDVLSEEELSVAEEEIYARHGKTFTDPELQSYFEARFWYTPSEEEFVANEFEQANLDLIRIYRSMQDGSLYRFGNRFVDAYPEPSAYALETSSTRLLTGQDLARLSETQLCVARNEIYARHGRVFEDPEMREYFYSRSWYKPTTSAADFDYDCVSQTEHANLSLIMTYEDMAENDIQWSSGNPYRSVYSKYSYRGYVIPSSDYYYLEMEDLYGMSVDELCVARNEIYARHGYTFTSQQLLEYFRHYSWYSPRTAPGDVDSVSLSAVEAANVELLNEAENIASDTSDRIFRESKEEEKENEESSGLSGLDLSKLDTTLGYTISLDMFSVTLPNYFKTYAVITTGENEIDIKEKSSSQTEWDGWLYSISITEKCNLEDFFAGTLTKDGKSYDVQVFWATDVRHTPEAHKLYLKMDGELDRIMATVTGINGWTFTPAK